MKGYQDSGIRGLYWIVKIDNGVSHMRYLSLNIIKKEKQIDYKTKEAQQYKCNQQQIRERIVSSSENSFFDMEGF